MELNHRGTRPATSGGITPPTGDAPTSGPIVEVRDHIWGDAPETVSAPSTFRTKTYRPNDVPRLSQIEPNNTVKDPTMKERVSVTGKLVTMPDEWIETRHGIQTWDNSAHDNEVIRWNPEFMGDEALDSGVVWGCLPLGDIGSEQPGGVIESTDFDGDKI